MPVTSGNMTLKDATNEAIRDWCCHPADTFYIIGSTVGPHPYPDMVARLQSVISEEIRVQLREKEGRDYPDYLMACVGGGSNAAGTVYHYLGDERVKIVLAEAGGEGLLSGRSAATIQLGREGIIHGARTLVMQTEDGQIEEPYSISAGLDYPGIGPLHANLAQTGRAKVVAVDDDEALRGAFELTRLEGIIPALGYGDLSCEYGPSGDLRQFVKSEKHPIPCTDLPRQPKNSSETCIRRSASTSNSEMSIRSRRCSKVPTTTAVRTAFRSSPSAPSPASA